MLRVFLLSGFTLSVIIGVSQKLITGQEAVTLSLQNRVNTEASKSELQQQQLLLGSSRVFDNPEAGVERSPYDPGALANITQRLLFPSVYSSRKALQIERIELSKLLLQLNSFEITRLIRSNYLEIQYFTERRDLLAYQDSLYRSVN